ncbi:MAG: hypothetical protein ABIG70_08905 [Pseudomonadota bacterium]
MLNAIGSPEFSSAPGIQSASGLEARLARYQRELSNCVKCNTANTREGRESIQALSDKISALKTRIEESANTNPGSHSATPDTKASADVSNSNEAATSIPGDTTRVVATSASGSENTSVGSRLDIFV